MVATIGNIIGSLAAGFVLIPVIGAERTMVLVMILYGAISVVALITSTWKYRKSTAIVMIAVVGAGILMRPRWDIHALTCGAFLYAPQYRQVKTFRDFKELVNQNEILFHADGQVSTVTVLQSPWNERFLRVNGKTDASWGYDMRTQLLLAYLPRFFFDGQPANALIIGLGAGVTAGACGSDQSMRSIDCVEIEPAVAKAAMFFTRVNKWIMKDPRFKLFYTDARHYVTGSRTEYDLIISEPSNPWMAGVSTLYTQEAFSLVKQRLTGKGLFCQWIHSYSMGEKDFKMLGSSEPMVFDYEETVKIIRGNNDMQQDLMGIDVIEPFTLLATTFMLDDEDVRRYVQGAEIHHDERLVLEFSAPHHLYSKEDMNIFYGVQKNKTITAPERRFYGLKILKMRLPGSIKPKKFKILMRGH
jgi:spermidine synthase